MGDHRWRARAEYLRRGTPIESADGLMVGQFAEHRTGDRLPWRFYDVSGTVYRVPLASDLVLDLRDPTARAHAAMVYTEIKPGPFGFPDTVRALRQAAALGADPHAWEHCNILCRMRALDETVTVAEARAALEWAEGVTLG